MNQNQNQSGAGNPQNFSGGQFPPQQNPQGGQFPPQQNAGQFPPQQFPQPTAGYGYPPQPGGMPPTPPPALGPDGKPLPPIGHFGRDDGFKTTIKLPKHNLKIDENLFLKLLAGSVSLSKDEKKKVIESVPRLRQQQADDLIRIFNEEKQKFSDLDTRHKEQLEKLEKQAKIDWEALEAEYGSVEKAAEEKSKAEEIRAQLSGAAGNQNSGNKNSNQNPPQQKSI